MTTPEQSSEPPAITETSDADSLAKALATLVSPGEDTTIGDQHRAAGDLTKALLGITIAVPEATFVQTHTLKLPGGTFTAIVRKGPGSDTCLTRLEVDTPRVRGTLAFSDKPQAPFAAASAEFISQGPPSAPKEGRVARPEAPVEAVSEENPVRTLLRAVTAAVVASLESTAHTDGQAPAQSPPAATLSDPAQA